MLTFTDNAIDKLNNIIETVENCIGVRLSIHGGGCSGFQYNFTPEFLSEQSIQTEYVHTLESGTFVVDSLSLEYIKGSTIDFVKGVMTEEFVVINPNSAGTCGCGHSFQVKV